MSTRDAERRSHRDPAERLALVARAKRNALLYAHRHMLRYEDLEDCFSQATVELVGYTRLRGRRYSTIHLANILELRFTSRVRDRCRAIHGRSPSESAMERALAIGSLGSEYGDSELADLRCGVEELVMLRLQLRSVPRLACELTADQRLVLLSQVSLEMAPAEFCERHGWSREKYRKVAQRGRAKLRRLSAGESDLKPGEPPMTIPPPLMGASPGGTDGRSRPRPLGDTQRDGGREPGYSPPRLPAARATDIREGGVMLRPRRPGEVHRIHRVCAEEDLPRVETWPEALPRRQRRWPTMALVGAVVGIVAVLAIHGLRSPGVVVGGSGGTALAPSGAPAEQGAVVRQQGAVVRAQAPRRRVIGGSARPFVSVAPRRRKAIASSSTTALVSARAGAPATAVAASTDAATPAPGAGSEFDFER